MPKLCKAGQQLREQIDDAFPNRGRASDGWLGDQRHAARRAIKISAEYNISVGGDIKVISQRRK